MTARVAVGWLSALAVVLAGGALHRVAEAALLPMSHWTGWTLVLAMALLGLQGIPRLRRQRSASAFLLVHLHLGWIAALVFFVHAGGLPGAAFHRAQWFAFALVLASGAVGFGLERLGARRQRDLDALPYPRIAEERAVLAAQANDAFHRIVRRGCPSAMARLYAQRLLPFLAGPVHLWRHWIGSRRPLDETLLELDYAGSTLAEDADFVRIREIVVRKFHLDRRWALYWLQRGWLFVHLPAAAVSTILLLFSRRFRSRVRELSDGCPPSH